MINNSLAPPQVLPLFAEIDALLLDLLATLTEEEWHKPTIAKQWTVKDIAAHLLDGNLRTLSIQRDTYFGETPTGVDSYQSLVAWLNQLNATWVAASKRISPAVLQLLLQATGKLVSDYYATLQPNDDALFSVAWAGETTSKNWLHVAREYTEKFIHQQQIREVVNKPALITHHFFTPFIHSLMYALPHVYKDVLAAEGTIIQLTITPVGGAYFLVKQSTGWQLQSTIQVAPTTEVIIPSDTAWKLFSNGITTQAASNGVIITGNATLGVVALSTRSFMV